MSGRRRGPASPAPAQGHAPAQVHYPQQVQTFSTPGVAEVSLRTVPNAPRGGQSAPQRGAPPRASSSAPAPVRYSQDAGGAWQDSSAPEAPYAQAPQAPAARPWRRFADRVRESTALVQEDRAEFADDELVDAIGEQAADAGNAFLELLSLALSTRQSPLTPALEERTNALVDAIDTHAAAAQGLYHGSRQVYGDEATRDAGDLAHDVPGLARIARVLCESILRPELRGQTTVVDEAPRGRSARRDEAPAEPVEPPPAQAPTKAEKPK